MGRRPGVKAEDTRTAILDAAAAEFGRHGYEGARLARIATSAGLSAGAIYNHYRSKADLLLAVVERSTANSLLHVVDTRSASDHLAAIAHLLVEQAPDEAPLVAELILASRRDPDAGRALLGQLRTAERDIAQRLRDAQANKQIAEDLNADVVARFAVMVGLGSLLVRAADLPPADPNDWTAFILRLAAGLAPSRGARPKSSRGSAGGSRRTGSGRTQS